MNLNKFRAMSLLIFGSALIVVQFQNCAKPHSALSEKTSNLSGAPVDSIDPIYSGTLSFDKPYVELSSQPIAHISGTCDVSQEGSILSWRLFEVETQLIEEGEAKCSGGRFSVKIDFVNEFPCNREYTLRALLGAKARDESVVIRICQ